MRNLSRQFAQRKPIYRRATAKIFIREAEILQKGVISGIQKMVAHWNNRTELVRDLVLLRRL